MGFEASASINNRSRYRSTMYRGDGKSLELYGLSNVQYGELVEFEGGFKVIVLNLERITLGVVKLLSPSRNIKEGGQGVKAHPDHCLHQKG